MKLGKVEFCHFLQILALFLCLSGMNQAELSRSRSKPYFQSGRTRTKRSWVWNQFFVLEEYMGTDPLYVGKVGDLNKLWRVQMWFWCVCMVNMKIVIQHGGLKPGWDSFVIWKRKMFGTSKQQHITFLIPLAVFVKSSIYQLCCFKGVH